MVHRLCRIHQYYQISQSVHVIGYASERQVCITSFLHGLYNGISRAISPNKAIWPKTEVPNLNIVQMG